MVLSEVNRYMSENVIEVANSEEPIDNTMGYSSYRIPIYGNLDNSGYCSTCTYYPVIATEGGSCLAIDNNRVYVPIKVPKSDAIKRYNKSGKLDNSHNTVIDAFDLPDIDIRLLTNNCSAILDPTYYSTGTISFDSTNTVNKFSYSTGDDNKLVTVKNLNDMLDKMDKYVETEGKSGSPAFWTTPVQVTN